MLSTTPPGYCARAATMEVELTACKPYGDPEKAVVFVIGHDPRLKRSDFEAPYTFCLDYLERPRPSTKGEQSKHDLAIAAYSYIKYLAGRSVSLEDMYFTNLCNEYLERPEKGTVLIPDEKADRGIRDIEIALSWGAFQVVIPMSLQVFYHLVRRDFVTDDPDEDLQTFLQEARPDPSAVKNSYVPVAKVSFLLVCGRTYHHKQTPVIPILHVQQWSPGNNAWRGSKSHMEKAAVNIHKALREAR